MHRVSEAQTSPSQHIHPPSASPSLLILPIPINPHRHRTKHTIQPPPQLPQLVRLSHPLLLHTPQLRLQLPNPSLLLRLRSPNSRQHRDEVLNLLFFDNKVPRQLALSRRENGGRVRLRWEGGVVCFSAGAFGCCAGLLCWWWDRGCLCCCCGVGAACGCCGDGGWDWWGGCGFGDFCEGRGGIWDVGGWCCGGVVGVGCEVS